MEGTLDRKPDGVGDAGRWSGPATPDPADDYCRRADLLMGQRRYAEAEPLLRKALRLRPDCPEIMNKLGATLWELGWPAKSEPFFLRRVRSSPTIRSS